MESAAAEGRVKGDKGLKELQVGSEGVLDQMLLSSHYLPVGVIIQVKKMVSNMLIRQVDSFRSIRKT